MAARVRQGPTGHVGGFVWNLTGLESALAHLLAQAAKNPGIGPNNLGDIVYKFESSGGFTAVFFVKSTAFSIAADACEMAQVAFDALGSTGERIIVQTDNGLAKFAVYVTSLATQPDTKREVLDELSSIEQLSTGDGGLSKRNLGPFTSPTCKNLKAKRWETVTVPTNHEVSATSPAKRAETAVSQLTANTHNVGCDPTNYTCEVVILTDNGQTKCVKCNGGTDYFVRTYNNKGHCGGAFFKSDDCTGNPIQGYKESVGGKCESLKFNSYYLECRGA